MSVYLGAWWFALLGPAAGCGGDTCDDDERQLCRGTFTCGEEGAATSTCDQATEICVLSPGRAFCLPIEGTSETNCPSPADGARVTPCFGLEKECRGDSSSGVTVSCSN